jgi:hypothetical protein
MHAPMKYVEKRLTLAASGAWVVFSRLNRITPRAAFTPAWSDLPMLNSSQKTTPPLGWPRQGVERQAAHEAAPAAEAVH